MDSGLASLALTTQLFQRPVETTQLVHRFGIPNGPCSVRDIVSAALSLRPKAKASQVDFGSIRGAVLPALGLAREGEPFLIACIARSHDGASNFLIQKPQRSQLGIPRGKVHALCKGKNILNKARSPLLNVINEKLNKSMPRVQERG